MTTCQDAVARGRNVDETRFGVLVALAALALRRVLRAGLRREQNDSHLLILQSPRSVGTAEDED